MAKNITQTILDPIPVVLAAAQVSGKPFVQGAQLLVPITDGAIGATVAVHYHCRGTFDKTTGEAWTANALLYWNNSTKKFTTTSAGNTLRGCAAASAASGDTSGEVLIMPVLV